MKSIPNCSGVTNLHHVCMDHCLVYIIVILHKLKNEWKGHKNWKEKHIRIHLFVWIESLTKLLIPVKWSWIYKSSHFEKWNFYCDIKFFTLDIIAELYQDVEESRNRDDEIDRRMMQSQEKFNCSAGSAHVTQSSQNCMTLTAVIHYYSI